MSRLSRITQVIFGSGGNVGTGGFGAAANGNTTTGLATGTTLSTIMGTANWLGGWLSAVLGSSKFPAVEDMNAKDYAITSQIAYILQQGAAIEYDSGTTYYQNSIVCKTGTYQFYGSKTNTNLGNALTDTVNWQYLGDLSSLTPNVFVGGTTTGTGNAMVLASVMPATGLTPSNGQTIICTAGFTNVAGACALTVTSPAIASTSVKIDSGSGLIDPPAASITAGDTIYLSYNSTSNAWVLTGGLALGTAAYKNASDNTQSILASIISAVATNHFAFFADNVGTLKDGGLATGTLSTTESDIPIASATGAPRLKVGRIATGGSATGTHNFAAAFNTACVGVWGVTDTSNSTFNRFALPSTPTASAFAWAASTNDSVIYWIAFGY